MNPYEILGVSETASDEEIAVHYRMLVRKHHPDRNGGDPTATARMKEINAARELLDTPQKRAAVDRFLKKDRKRKKRERHVATRPIIEPEPRHKAADGRGRPLVIKLRHKARSKSKSRSKRKGGPSLLGIARKLVARGASYLAHKLRKNDDGDDKDGPPPRQVLRGAARGSLAVLAEPR
jgi:curved DNA-binding protein CbpA